MRQNERMSETAEYGSNFRKIILILEKVILISEVHHVSDSML